MEPNVITVNWYVIALVINFIITVAGVAFIWGKASAMLAYEDEQIKSLKESVTNHTKHCEACRRECQTDLSRRLEKIETFMRNISKFMGNVSQFMKMNSPPSRSIAFPDEVPDSDLGTN